jgi:hypothetical protein
LFFILAAVSQQLIKKPRFGPKVATSGWWLDKANTTPTTTKWTELSPYQLGRCRVLAEYDFLILGEEKGEQEEQTTYPGRLNQKPHYFEKVGNLEWRDFRLYSWLNNTKALNLPLSSEAITWLEYLSTKGNQVAAAHFLDRFREQNQIPFDILLEEEYNSGPQQAPLISSVKFNIPEGEWFKGLNNSLQDNRYIPTIDGWLTVISPAYIKIYLEERLEEFLALGGLKELLDRKPFIETGLELPDPFYWDLWGEVDHLRESYSEYCDQHHLDPLELD